MTAPDQSSPSGALGPGLFAERQAMTEEDAKAQMRGVPLSSWDSAQDAAHSTYNDAIASNSTAITDLSAIAVTSVTTPIWDSTGGSDITTFPRVLMQQVPQGTTGSGGGGSTGSSDGTGFHSHSLSSHDHTILTEGPRYAPGKQVMDAYFLRADRKGTYTRFKAIMGGDGLLLDIDAIYFGLYGIDPNTNTAQKIWDSGNVKSMLSKDRKEYIFNTGTTFNVEPGHLLAAAQLQIAPGAVQTTRSVACIYQSGVAQAAGTYPPAAGGYIQNQSFLPSSFGLNALTLDNGKIGWFAIAP